MDKKISNKLNKENFVGIIDYGFGNIASVKNALNYLKIKNKVISSPIKKNKFSHLILPGDGFFPKAAQIIKKNKWDIFIKDFINGKKKILGICVGMQLLLSFSTEGRGAKGLNLVSGKIEKFSKKKNFSLPHMGFNMVKFNDNKFKDLEGYYYFIHSFRLKKIKDKSIVTGLTRYSDDFVSFFKKDNLFGTQFHPEKSGQRGLIFLKKFILD